MTENERMNSIKGKIKPCLCGSVPSLVYEKVGYYDDRLYFFIHCDKCGIKMEGIPHSPFSAIEEKMKFAEETIEKWSAWVSKYNMTNADKIRSTELLLQAAKEIKEICDNADGCDECPFSYDVGRYDVSCKFMDKSGHRCDPLEWRLDGNS